MSDIIHPEPDHCPQNVAVTLFDGDDPDDFAIDVDDEAIAARTTFSWTVKFTVSGTWVADGFDLDHDRALAMLAHDLGYADDHELDAQVLSAPPPTTLLAIQGGRCVEAATGQSVLDGLRALAVAQAREQKAWVDAGGYSLPDDGM